MKCIHHNDMDGRLAARIVADFENNYNQRDFFEMDYTEELPYNEISKDELVYVVDYSFTRDKKSKLDRLLEITDNLVWIDHHKSSIELITEFPQYKKIKGSIVEGKSGAALTYMYLHKKSFEEIPQYVKYVSDYDCWIYDYGDLSKDFKCYIDSVDSKPFADVWTELAKDTWLKYTIKCIEEGRTIRRYIEQEYKRTRENRAYELEIEGYKALCINSEGNSWLFGDKITEYPICMLWTYNGNTYNYSLYSDQDREDAVDVSKICEKYGGGGHPGASGIQSVEKIW